AATDCRLNLYQEKSLLARQQTEKIAFELRRQREEFIPLPLACEALTTCNVLIKGQLLNLAHKLKSLLPEIEPKRVTILDEQIRATLSNLGQLRLPAEFLERLRAWQVEGKEIPGHEKTTAPQKRNGISEGTRDKREAASKKTRQDSKKRGRKLTQRTGQGVGNLPPAAAPGKKGDRQTTESQSQGPKT
ncbi:MAG: hypothetical protein U1E51_28085, partial [Candidatus Binatia bacterium]|nr:hypothetical protein [Candidatus Binatia bacterium]